MALQSKKTQDELVVAETKRPSKTRRTPAAISSLTGSAVNPVGSPALALQQQLVERMDDILNGSERQEANPSIVHQNKWPIPVSLAVITSASGMLWLAIGIIASQII